MKTPSKADLAISQFSLFIIAATCSALALMFSSSELMEPIQALLHNTCTEFEHWIANSVAFH